MHEGVAAHSGRFLALDFFLAAASRQAADPLPQVRSSSKNPAGERGRLPRHAALRRFSGCRVQVARSPMSGRLGAALGAGPERFW